MPKEGLEVHLGDLEEKAAYIEKNAAALKTLPKLDPAAMMDEVAGIVTANAAQEALKIGRGDTTEVKADAVNEAMILVSSILFTLRGAITKAKKLKLLKSLPKTSKADSFKGKIGVIKSLLGFLKANPTVSGKVTPAEVKELSDALKGTVTAGSAARTAKSDLPESTQALEAHIHETSVNATAWLHIYHGIYTLTKDKKALKVLNALRAKSAKAVPVPVPATTTGGA